MAKKITIINESMESVSGYKVGDKIRIIKMSNPGSKIDDSRYNGRIGTIESIDDAGQLHGTWGGLAVIPEVDKIEIINESVHRQTGIIKESDMVIDFKSWTSTLSDDEIEEMLIEEYTGKYLTSWLNMLKDKDGHYDINNKEVHNILFDYFINCFSDHKYVDDHHNIMSETLHDVISQDPKTKKWRIRGHHGYWPQRYSTKEKAENALKAFHANESVVSVANKSLTNHPFSKMLNEQQAAKLVDYVLDEFEVHQPARKIADTIKRGFDKLYHGYTENNEPEKLEDVFTGHGWDIRRIRKDDNGAYMIWVVRKTGAFGEHFGSPLVDEFGDDDEHIVGLISHIENYFRDKKNKRVKVEFIPEYADKKPYDEVIRIS